MVAELIELTEERRRARREAGGDLIETLRDIAEDSSEAAERIRLKFPASFESPVRVVAMDAAGEPGGFLG